MLPHIGGAATERTRGRKANRAIEYTRNIDPTVLYEHRESFCCSFVWEWVDDCLWLWPFNLHTADRETVVALLVGQVLTDLRQAKAVSLTGLSKQHRTSRFRRFVNSAALDRFLLVGARLISRFTLRLLSACRVEMPQCR